MELHLFVKTITQQAWKIGWFLTQLVYQRTVRISLFRHLVFVLCYFLSPWLPMVYLWMFANPSLFLWMADAFLRGVDSACGATRTTTEIDGGVENRGDRTVSAGFGECPAEYKLITIFEGLMNKSRIYSSYGNAPVVPGNTIVRAFIRVVAAMR